MTQAATLSRRTPSFMSRQQPLSICLRRTRRQSHTFAHEFLGVGGIPYDPTELKQASLTRGYDANELSNLPASKDEVLAAEAAIHDPTDTLLLGIEGYRIGLQACRSRTISHYPFGRSWLRKQCRSKSLSVGSSERSRGGRRRLLACVGNRSAPPQR